MAGFLQKGRWRLELAAAERMKTRPDFSWLHKQMRTTADDRQEKTEGEIERLLQGLLAQKSEQGRRRDKARRRKKINNARTEKSAP
jgi:hypothetical protein